MVKILLLCLPLVAQAQKLSLSQVQFLEPKEENVIANDQVSVLNNLEVSKGSTHWWGEFEFKYDGLIRVDSNYSERNILILSDLSLNQSLSFGSYSLGLIAHQWSMMDLFNNSFDPQNLDSFDNQTQSQPGALIRYDFYEGLIANSFMELSLTVPVFETTMPTVQNRQGFGLKYNRHGHAVDGEFENQASDPNIHLRFKKYTDWGEWQLLYLNSYAYQAPFTRINTPFDEIGITDNLEFEALMLPVEIVGLSSLYLWGEAMLRAEILNYNFDNTTVEQTSFDADAFPPIYADSYKPNDLIMINLAWEYAKNYSNNHGGRFQVEYQRIAEQQKQEQETASWLGLFQNDIAMAYRHDFNDIYSTYLEAGVLWDLAYGDERIWNATMGSRINDQIEMKITSLIVDAPGIASGLEGMISARGLRPLSQSDYTMLSIAIQY